MKKIEGLAVKDDASAIVDKVSGNITLENPTEKIVLDFPAVEVAIQLEPIQNQLCLLLEVHLAITWILIQGVVALRLTVFDTNDMQKHAVVNEIRLPCKSS